MTCVPCEPSCLAYEELVVCLITTHHHSEGDDRPVQQTKQFNKMLFPGGSVPVPLMAQERPADCLHCE